MRWDELFADLEARFDELSDAAATAESADRERLAIGAIRAEQRMAGAVGQPIRLRIVGGGSVAGFSGLSAQIFCCSRRRRTGTASSR